jgi:hypothetical protein
VLFIHTSQEKLTIFRLGHSSKGYTDGEIGVEWIKQFDQQTRAKAAGRRRLLLVDGHNSHYTRGFLEYARKHRIHILCYPSHSTHIYQGLDVVIFSVLKRRWTKARDEYEHQRGHKVDKTNFLSVYAQAHTQALSKENIIAAFRKTGIVPLDRNVVTDEMLAPSTTSSSKGFLPIRQASPVRVMEDMIHRQLAREAAISQNDAEEDASPEETRLHPSDCVVPPQISTPVRVAINTLASTSAAFLVSKTPPSSRVNPPRFTPYTVSPLKRRQEPILDDEPQTEREVALIQALREADERDTWRKRAMIGMQATTVLQGMYIAKVQGHLEEHEKRAAKKKSGNRLFGDGYGKLLTGDDFYNSSLEIEEQAKQKAEEKVERARMREEHATVVAQWKNNEVARKARNDAVRKSHQDAVKAWEAERDLAKEERRKARWTKPKQGLLEKPVPRPKKPDDKSESDEEGPDDDEDNAIDGD